MRNRFLWQVIVSIAPEAEEPVAELLQNIFQQPATILLDFNTGATRASVYLHHPNDCSPGKLAQLKSELRSLRATGLPIGSGKISCRKIPRENWAESWKRHFTPIQVGRELLLKPEWSKLRPRKNQAVVILNPGLSFGTGQHPTTRFCLEQLVACKNAQRAQSCLDLGTGSGILAIAATKLGYRPVLGIDSDPDALRIARANATQNKVQNMLRLECRDLASFNEAGPGYDVICANLMYDLLLAQKDRIVQHLKPGGRLVLAGILREQFSSLRKAFETSGLKLLRSKIEKGWRSGAFAFADKPAP